MHIEVLNTGNELLLGTTLNTHGAWLGQTLFPHGLRIARQTTVCDGEPIRAAFQEAIQRSDALIITGGLGPTSDDLTRDVVAEELGIELIEDEAAVRSLHAFFEKIGRPMAQANLRQAQVPVGAEVVPNPNGTAPGLYLPPRLSKERRCAVFLLPGPPRELQPMVLDEVVPILRALAGVDEAQEMIELHYTGIGESELALRVDEKLGSIEGLEFGYCARPGEVDLRLIGSSELLERVRAEIAPLLNEFYIGDSTGGVEGQLIKEATAAGLKIATAESCTGGLIASRLTDVAGSSAVLEFGWVSYANRAKAKELGVSEASLEQFGAVSEEVVIEMAKGALAESGADLAVAVSGIAGPDGGTDEKPVGTVWLAWARKDGQVKVMTKRHKRNRAAFKMAVSQEALFGLLKEVRQLAG